MNISKGYGQAAIFIYVGVEREREREIKESYVSICVLKLVTLFEHICVLARSTCTYTRTMFSPIYTFLRIPMH